MNVRLTRRLWRVAVEALVGIIMSGFALIYPTDELVNKYGKWIKVAYLHLANMSLVKKRHYSHLHHLIESSTHLSISSFSL